MANQTRPSRFNPGYLAFRHAGMLFSCLALGLCAGMAWRTLVEPTSYYAKANLSFFLEERTDQGVPESINWEAKATRWESVPTDARDQSLLGANLRYVVKLAATAGQPLDTDALDVELALFSPGRIYSTLLPPPGLPIFGPSITITRRDLAANLDFHSLALIVADLDPPRDAASWDFSFFDPGFGQSLVDGMIVRPGPDDHYFKVFYHLYAILNNGRAPASPEMAWRAAVDEVTERLEREAGFAGGGGFGRTAKRELLREIAAIPVLVANALYHAFAWSHGDGDFQNQTALWAGRWSNQADLVVTQSGDSGFVTADMNMVLNPVLFPRDTALTRLPPICTAVILAYLAALERPGAAAKEEPAPAPAPARPAPTPEPAESRIVTIEPVIPPEPAATPAPEMTPDALERHRELLAQSDTRLRRAKSDRDTARRNLETLRARETALLTETLSARERADRLAARLDTAAEEIVPAASPISREEARLKLARDEVLERLAMLLQTCTEEHPFVIQARRELAAIDALIHDLDPDRLTAKQAEAQETRIRNLRLEWQSALTAADNLEERRRRLTVQVENAEAELETAERAVADADIELARLTAEKPAAPRRESPVAAPVPAAKPEMRQPSPPPKPQPPAPEPPAPRQAALVFTDLPRHIALEATPPDWNAPLTGLLAGLCLGLLWMALREIGARRFASASEARYLVGLPLLAALPPYDPRSMRAAAGTMKGELVGGKRGEQVFVPTPVELSEPKPGARRGKITPARPHRKWLGWIAGLVLLGLAALLYFTPAKLVISPPGLAAQLDLPAAMQEYARGGEWGNMP